MKIILQRVEVLNLEKSMKRGVELQNICERWLALEGLDELLYGKPWERVGQREAVPDVSGRR